MSDIQEEQKEQIRQQVAQDQAEAFNPEVAPLEPLEPVEPVEPEQEQIPRIKTRKTPEELEQQREVDSRSVFIGNVDYNSTTDEIEEHFKVAGTINRVTILFNHYTGRPKGHAYVEYETASSVEKAVAELNDTEFKGRQISVLVKRTNLPGLGKRGGFRGRGRGAGHRGGSFRGRGRGRGGYNAASGPGREDVADEVENTVIAE